MTMGGVGMFAAGLVAVAALVAEQPIRVTPVVADSRVSVSFTAPSAIGSDARELVQSGLLLTLTFQIDLRAPLATWFDRTLAETTVSSTVKFDNLTGVYHVSRLRDGHVVWSERTSDFAQARGWATTFEAVPVAATTALEANAEYYLRVRLRSSPRRSFPFWPWASHDGTGRAPFTFIR